jgi:hypothetical protein
MQHRGRHALHLERLVEAALGGEQRDHEVGVDDGAKDLIAGENEGEVDGGVGEGEKLDASERHSWLLLAPN